jgi:N-acetylmuramoyl-L-alanine amidase
MYVLSLALLAAFALHGLRETVTVSAEETTSQLIILDAGHGGTDGGAAGVDGTRECDVNLQITLKIDAVLGLLGEETLLVRDMDTDLADSSANSIAQKKVSDIRNRVQLANSHPDGLLVSIHCNTYPEQKYHGAQVFYGKVGASKILATTLQDTLAAQVDPSNNRTAKQIASNVYLMNHIEVPGILVECGFLTNPDELQNLKSDAYQKRLAVAIAATVTNYLSEDHSEV